MLLGVVNSNTAQEAYFSVGRNFTTYDYTNSAGERNPNVKGSSGMYYEMSFLFRANNHIGFAVGITLNELNATGGTFVDNYSWDTNYLGIQGVFKYKIIGQKSNWCSRSSSSTGFSMNINAGINFNHLINGQQKINGLTYNLLDSSEFNGFFIQPLIGLDLNYVITDNVSLGLGYHVSKSFRTSSSGDEKLRFNNSQLQFNIIISLY
jgi:hypothetical protein